MLFSQPSCPALCRASTSAFVAKAWMAETSPAMTDAYSAANRFPAFGAS